MGAKPLGPGSPTPCLAACGGGTLPRAQVPHLSRARGGLGRRRDPGPPRPADLSAELQAGPCRGNPSAARHGRPEGKGAQPSTWRGAGRRTWGPLGARLWVVSAGPGARPGPGDPQGGCVPPHTPHGPPRASSPGLRAAASRALRPRLGLARLGSVRFGSPREEPPGLRLARGGASGSVLIGQGPGVERACPPQPRPRAPGPAET